jgi:hypothetical protein
MATSSTSIVIDTESLDARGLAGKGTLIEPTGQDMRVDMKDSLASSLTRVEHQAEFSIGVLAREFLGHRDEVREKLGVTRGQLGNVCILLCFWHHKKVDWCLRGNIPKSNEVVVFHDDVRGDFPRHNLGKD